LNNPKRRLALIIVCSIVFIVLVLLIAYFATQGDSPAKIAPNPFAKLLPSESKLQKFKKAAVCTDAVVCSKVGR
jgi:uncharacterized protein YpmB